MAIAISRSLVRAIAGLALASGLWACEVALRADGQAPQCDMEGQLCSTPDADPLLTCTGGQCLPCTPDLTKCQTCGVPAIAAQLDKDGDGYKVCGVAGTIDCNDDPATGKNIHPGAKELCNGIDDNCNNQVDEEPNECSLKGQKCLSALHLCVDKTDCRLPAAACKSGFSCDLTTGKCQTGDCTIDPTGCPTGQHCDPVTHACLSQAAPGAPCSAIIQCDGTGGTHCIALSDAGIGSPAGSICTTECCSSDECPAGSVCKQGGSIAGVCVPASMLGLTVGSGAAYSGCANGQVCHSGVCSSGHCVDGCCGAVACGSGGTCSYSPSTSTMTCGASGGSGNPGDSKGSGGCKSHLWLAGGLFGSDTCTQQCCSSSDCPDSTYTCGTKPVTSTAGTININVCIQTYSGGGSKVGGDLCGGDTECRSGRCSAGRCDDLCCRDRDCGSGTHCAPQNIGGVFVGKCVLG